ncbi:MAG TPA: hypothetical protein DEA44_14170, partial [Firmicutes bacterium]|nr:hypothetical protein [Bacillota bacterium]
MDGLVNEQKNGDISRRIIHVTGIVQGVGFRPFIFQIARRYGLYGWVFNSSAGVQIEVEGEEKALQGFFSHQSPV